jgi:hypothetical protein
MIGAIDRLISGQLEKWVTKSRGKFVFVDGGSSGPTHNNNDGLSPYTPKQTLTAGLALLDDLSDDVLFVINYGANGRAAEPAWPVTISKSLIHVLGLQCMDNSKWPTVKPADDNHAFDITGQRVELAQLEIGGGATKAAIHVGSAGGIWSACLHDLWFGITGDTAGQDGVYVAAGEDAPYLMVEDCQFGSFVTRYGVLVDGNATRGMIGYRQGNFFKSANIAINIAGGAGLTGILNNVFGLPSDTAGYAITMGAGTSGTVIDGNRAAYQIAAMTNNPFRDLSVTANHWLVNYQQGLTVAPVTI